MSRRPAVARPVIAPQPTAKTAPQWLRPLIVALAIALMAAVTSTEVGDPDTFQHLASGKYLVERHAFPFPDPFSFTTAMVKPAYDGEFETRAFNIRHEPLAQILIYLTYAIAGFAGLVLLRYALLTGFCALLGLVAKRRTGSFYAALAAAALAASVAYRFRSDRPALFTYVLLAATLAILEYRRGLWGLPLLFLLWANAHGGFIMGWVAVAIYGAEALVERWRGRASNWRPLLMAGAAAVLVSGCNPNGFAAVPVLLAYRKSVMQSTLGEWQLPAYWPPGPFLILLACGLVALLWARRRTRPVDWLLLLVFGAASLTAQRNIIFAALVAPLIVAYLPWKRRLPVWPEYALALLAVAGIGLAAGQGRAFQFHTADWKYPARAADFMLAHHITAPMFNTYGSGAYLIWRLWPQERVFIDGRAQSETVYLDYQRIVYGLMRGPVTPATVYQALRPQVTQGKSAEELLRQYGVEVILMDGFEYTSGTPYYLAAALADPGQSEWKLVYVDAQAMLYMRHPPADVPLLNSLDTFAGMEAQCGEHLRHEPEMPRCAAGLADLFGRSGESRRAQYWQAVAGRYGATFER